MRRRLAAAAALGVACLACGDGPNEVVKDEVCPTAPVPLCGPAMAAVVAAARDGLSDAAGRSVPAIENAAAKTGLTASLGQLQGALASPSNVTVARRGLQGARDALAAARGQLTSFPGDAADLAAIELLLDQVAPLLGVS